MSERITYEAHAWLRIVTESLHPSDITEALQTQPSQVHFKGEARRVGDRKPYELNSWSLDSTVGSGSYIADHVRELADFVARKAEELNHLVESARAEIQMSCFVYYSGPNEHGSVEMDPEIVAKLAMAPVKLTFEFYDTNGYAYRTES